MLKNVIKDWDIKSYDNYVTVVGKIYNDSKKGIKDGSDFETTPIFKIDFANGVVQTLTSIYNLA